MAFLRTGMPIPTKGKGMRLSQKQLRFVEAYTDSKNLSTFQKGKASVLIAGYLTNNPGVLATELLGHPLVKKTIQEIMEARRDRMELSADYLVLKLMTLVDETEKDSDRIRAIELLGKVIALWKDRQEISGPDGEAIQMEQRQRIEEDVDEFNNQLKRLSRSASSGASSIGTAEVLKLPINRSKGSPKV